MNTLFVVSLGLVAGALVVHAVVLLGPRGVVRLRAWRARQAERIAGWAMAVCSWGAATRRVAGRVSRGAWALVRATPTVVGLAVVLVACDWAAGAVAASVREADGSNVTTTLDRRTASLPPADDPRVDGEALSGSPWADRYFAELEALEPTYVPFIGPRERSVRGRYVNSAEGIRRSYEPAGADDDAALEVWFFGGSTLWGEGQRDGHTIPSEVARLAEGFGVPLRSVNFGLRGYTAFQEMLLLEQEVNRRGPPDLAVFYHGFNELSTLTESPESLQRQPVIFQLATTREAFDRAPAVPGAMSPPEPSVTRDYADTSAAHRVWRWLREAASIGPAGADEPFYQPPPELMAIAVDDAEAIYRRSMALLGHVARSHQVPMVTYWQPTAPWPAYDELTARVATVGGGIDVTDAFAGEQAPVYIDGIHTNELGARLVAEAMWPTLSDQLPDVVAP